MMLRSPFKTLSERVHGQIRADIVAGRHAPDSKLRIEELRARYDVGASPLREALNRLAAEGFVIAIGQRGFRVAPISTEELLDLTRVRVLLETEALRESIARGDGAWEAGVVAAYHRLSREQPVPAADPRGYEERNHDFHEALVAACRSPLLLRYRATVYDQQKRYRALLMGVEPVARDLHAEHHRIMTAALARDVDGACAESAQHIRSSADEISALLARLRRPDARPAVATTV